MDADTAALLTQLRAQSAVVPWDSRTARTPRSTTSARRRSGSICGIADARCRTSPTRDTSTGRWTWSGVSTITSFPSTWLFSSSPATRRAGFRAPRSRRASCSPARPATHGSRVARSRGGTDPRAGGRRRPGPRGADDRDRAVHGPRSHRPLAGGAGRGRPGRSRANWKSPNTSMGPRVLGEGEFAKQSATLDAVRRPAEGLKTALSVAISNPDPRFRHLLEDLDTASWRLGRPGPKPDDTRLEAARDLTQAVTPSTPARRRIAPQPILGSPPSTPARYFEYRRTTRIRRGLQPGAVGSLGLRRRRAGGDRRCAHGLPAGRHTRREFQGKASARQPTDGMDEGTVEEAGSHEGR